MTEKVHANCEINPPPLSKAQFRNQPIMGSISGLQQFTVKGLRYGHIPFDLAWPQQTGTGPP
jgi:hypothetical protein